VLELNRRLQESADLLSPRIRSSYYRLLFSFIQDLCEHHVSRPVES